jgi:hypothetical protein
MEYPRGNIRVATMFGQKKEEAEEYVGTRENGVEQRFCSACSSRGGVLKKQGFLSKRTDGIWSSFFMPPPRAF